MNLQGPKSRVSGSTAIATFALVAALLWAPDRAAAHGDDGSMDVQSSAQTGPNMLRLEVSIPYPDGDLADNATVTATLNGPRGTVIPNVPVPRTVSGYAADLAVTGPGTWWIAVRSLNPIAEATIEVNITGAGTAEHTNSPMATSQTRARPHKLPALVLLVAFAVAAPVVGLGLRRRRRPHSGG